MRLRSVLAAAFAFLFLAGPALAGVTISFYAHRLGSKGLWVEFPHAYVVLSGDVGGKPVKVNYGFTPPVVGPSILFGKVNGVVVGADDAYVAQDTPVITIPLSDRQYSAVLAVVARWKNEPQPSYDLDTHNCVIFVREIAAASGLTVTDDDTYVRKPAAFLEDLRERNTTYLARLAGGKTDIADKDARKGGVPVAGLRTGSQRPATAIISP